MSDRSIKIYIDSNVYNEITATEETRRLVFSAAEKGAAEFYYSSVTQDELEATPTEKKAELRKSLLSVMRELPSRTLTSPVVFGMGRYGDAAFGDETANKIFEGLRGRFGPKDALHVSTANAARCDYFVTNERN